MKPDDITLECDQEVIHVSVSASDQCKHDTNFTCIETIVESGSSNYCGDGEIIQTKTWTATDVCGNEATATKIKGTQEHVSLTVLHNTLHA